MFTVCGDNDFLANKNKVLLHRGIKLGSLYIFHKQCNLFRECSFLNSLGQHSFSIREHNSITAQNCLKKADGKILDRLVNSCKVDV